MDAAACWRTKSPRWWRRDAARGDGLGQIVLAETDNGDDLILP
jgi:hypothetical protein